MSDLDAEKLQQFSDEFSDLCQVRHETGAEEYGSVAFMTAPLFSMAAEELADLSNYARYMYVKLRSIEEALIASGFDLSTLTTEEVWQSDEVPPDSSAFVPSEDLQGFLPRQGRKG